MTNLTHEQYKEMLDIFAQDVLGLRKHGEDVCLTEYASCSEYTFKPNKALELLAVSENAFEANRGDEFINPIHYDNGILSETLIMTMALNALVMDMGKTIDRLS